MYVSKAYELSLGQDDGLAKELGDSYSIELSSKLSEGSVLGDAGAGGFSLG